MDILEMQQRKSLLESTIMKLLNDFEEETSTKINYVNFDRAIELSVRGSFIHSVNLEIRL